jgi:hypothetical protein
MIVEKLCIKSSKERILCVVVKRGYSVYTQCDFLSTRFEFFHPMVISGFLGSFFLKGLLHNSGEQKIMIVKTHEIAFFIHRA